MKKRIFGMLLMGAMVIASMSMFTSCKDYDDDIKANKEEITALKSQLTTELSNIRTQLASDLAAAKSELKTAIDAKANQSDVEAVKNSVASKAEASELTALVARVAALETQVLAIDDVLAKAASASDVAALNDQVVALAATLAAQTGEIDELKATIAAVKSSSQANAQAAQENAEAAAELAAEVLAASTNLGLQEAALDLLEARVAELEKQGTGIDQSVIDDLKNDIKDANAKIADLESALGNYAKLSDLRSYAKLTDLNGLAKASDLNAYAKITELAKYVQTSELANYAKKSDLNDYAKKAEFDAIKKDFQALSNKVDTFSGDINILKMYVKRNLSSLVLRPDTYYGGIEGISVKIYQLPEEKNNPESTKYMYRYFDRVGTVNVSDKGEAHYHVNPINVDLSNYTVDFYNWHSAIKEPAAKELITPTRSGDEGGISPVYTTTDDLLKANAGNLKNGILTVPFKADAATIESNLMMGIGTIASLSLTKKGNKAGVPDTTVNSDYAIVVPDYNYGMLIGDLDYQKWNLDKTDTYVDYIGYDNSDVNSENLHRSFSFLALAATSPTHDIKYDGSFDITSRLVTRVVKQKADWEAIKDTVNNGHANHHAIAKWNETTLNKDEDGDCSIDKNKVDNWDLTTLDNNGFEYDIQLVNYTLGTNKTGESVHLELITNKDGHVIAYPRNVTADGKTITGETANASCVGRQPIVCIMVREKATKKIVSFAYMKFLITQYEPTPDVEKEADFEIKDIWVNCKDDAGRVTWSEIEYHILNKLFADEETGEGGMSKKDFDKNYVFDYYDQTTEKVVDEKGATYTTVTRWGVQYNTKGGKRIDETKSFGSIEEQYNLTSQGVEDATTHILKWSFTSNQLNDKAEALKAAKKLTDKDKDGKVLDYYVNTDPIVTWVRYAHLSYTPITDMPAVGKEAAKGNPSIWVKLTIPAGEFHVAKGDMGANKILTYWYDLNSQQNALGTDDAFEVRINVPVPVPEVSASKKTIGYYYKGQKITINDDGTTTVTNDCGDALDIRYDNILEKAGDIQVANYTVGDATPDGKNRVTDAASNTYSEFTKDLKDFFIKGELTATVKMSSKFSSIKGMKLGCEFIYPSKALGNVKAKAETDPKDPRSDSEIEGSNEWVVYGSTGAKYTLKLDATHTKIQIVDKTGGTKVDTYPKDLITLNYDANDKVNERQITVLNYVNGVDQDDILNYRTHNELGQGRTFSAYINIKAINACAPVYWDNMWFNARFIRPLDLEEPKQALVPDAPNDWHEVDLTDALIVKDWREYYGDRLNRTAGKDVSLNLPIVGTKKAFDYDYYQVKVQIGDGAFYTDAAKGKTDRDAGGYSITGGNKMISVDSKSVKSYLPTTDVPNLKFEKISDTKLRYLNNSGVTGGFHVFVPVTMTYVYGWMSIPQTKWVTIGVTASVEQAMIEGQE